MIALDMVLKFVVCALMVVVVLLLIKLRRLQYDLFAATLRSIIVLHRRISVLEGTPAEQIHDLPGIAKERER